MLSYVKTAASGSDAKLPTQPDAFRAFEHSAAGEFVPLTTRGPEIALTVTPRAGEGLSEMFLRLADSLQGAAILNLLVFGAADAAKAAAEAMRRTFGKVDWPVTWVEGGSCHGNAIAGMQASGFIGRDVQRIRLGGRVVGSVFQDANALHCVLGDLGPRLLSPSRADQTTQTLENLEAALAQAGFSIADTVRTWFFLDDILSWYGDFNRARTRVYSGVKFRTGSLPASTGVGARNRHGAALTLGARAMRPLNDSARAVEIASPLQCPAPAYGSSFSRAMEISSTAGRQIFISGTASIAPGGETLWRDDLDRQVKTTMLVVEAMLRARGYSLADLTRAVAYFKHPAYAGAFTAWCAARNLSSLPVVPACCDICRDDLLFEFEADAQKPA